MGPRGRGSRSDAETHPEATRREVVARFPEERTGPSTGPGSSATRARRTSRTLDEPNGRGTSATRGILFHPEEPVRVRSAVPMDSAGKGLDGRDSVYLQVFCYRLRRCRPDLSRMASLVLAKLDSPARVRRRRAVR